MRPSWRIDMTCMNSETRRARALQKASGGVATTDGEKNQQIFFVLFGVPAEQVSRYSRSRMRGLTLIETIVYIAVFSLTMVAIADAVQQFYKTNRYVFEQVNQIDSARKGIALLVDGLRKATYSESGSYPIEAAADNSITFYDDYDNDGTVERVRYFLSGTDFARGIIEPSGSPAMYTGPETITTAAHYVRNVEQSVNIFKYYDTNGALISSPFSLIAIRYVQVNLIVNVNPETRPNEFSLRSSAAIRNIKSNL